MQVFFPYNWNKQHSQKNWDFSFRNILFLTTFFPPEFFFTEYFECSSICLVFFCSKLACDIYIYVGTLQTIDGESVYFAASRTSGEIQHYVGDFTLHSRFGSKYLRCFPTICSAKNVKNPTVYTNIPMLERINSCLINGPVSRIFVFVLHFLLMLNEPNLFCTFFLIPRLQFQLESRRCLTSNPNIYQNFKNSIFLVSSSL